jgi:hypothetical protein
VHYVRRLCSAGYADLVPVTAVEVQFVAIGLSPGAVADIGVRGVDEPGPVARTRIGARRLNLMVGLPRRAGGRRRYRGGFCLRPEGPWRRPQRRRGGPRHARRRLAPWSRAAVLTVSVRTRLGGRHSEKVRICTRIPFSRSASRDQSHAGPPALRRGQMSQYPRAGGASQATLVWPRGWGVWSSLL